MDLFSRWFWKILAAVFTVGFLLGGLVGVIGFCLAVDAMTGAGR